MSLEIIDGNDPFAGPSFRLRNRVARAVWGLSWILLFRCTPKILHGWRIFVLRSFGAKIGVGVRIHPSVRIWAPWNLEIGDQVGIGAGAMLYNMALISIGCKAVVSQGAHLCAGSHDIDSANFQLIAKPIVLEGGVWVCAEAFVGPGVHIAMGSVIGARAVVMKSVVRSWSVWAGNPARHVRDREFRCENE